MTLLIALNVNVVGKEKLKMNKCKDCKYCHEYKKLINGEWEYSSCCTYWVQTESNPDYHSTVLYTESDDECEVFASNRDCNEVNFK